jgi:excisionase family DNA binding protein
VPPVSAPIQTYTVNEIRKVFKVARSTVYQWFKLGLKSLKLGGVRRVRATDLDRFMEQHRAS